MPKSLSTGPSKSVQIKCPESDKLAIVAVLREGETLSELTRRLWRDEVKKRKFGESMTGIFNPVPNHANFASNILKEICNGLSVPGKYLFSEPKQEITGKLGEIAIEKEAKDHG